MLKEIINELKNSFKDIKFDSKLPKFKKFNTINLFQDKYIDEILNESIKNLLSDLKLPEFVINLPSVEGPDFVVDTRSVFLLNKDRFSNINDTANYIFDTLNKKIQALQFLSSINKQGIFVNLYINQDFLYNILKQIYEIRDKYGSKNVYNGKKIIIDYSSPNMAKQMTVGHLRSTIIGEVLSNILENFGANVLRWNYLGDWGTPFGKLIYAFLNIYKGIGPENLIKEIGTGSILIENLKNDPIFVLGKLYAGFKDFQDNEKEDKARDFFKKLSIGDNDIKYLWELFRVLSLKDFSYIYKLFDINFDTFLGEAFVEQYTKEIIDDLKKAGYLAESKGALVVYFKKEKIGKDFSRIPLKLNEIKDYTEEDLEVLLIQKQDGTTLYATRDLAGIKFRSKILGAEEIFYVVGREQALHFNLVFALSDKLGYISKDNLNHIEFGLLLLGGKKMSSRQGNVYRLAELIDLVSKEILNKYGDRIDTYSAIDLAVSAIIINDLKNDRIKDINFDISAMTNLQGDTGIYLQYGKVRLKNLLKKIQDKFGNLNIDFQINYSYNNFEKKIIYLLGIYPMVLKSVLENYKINILVKWLFDVVKAFNSWYSNSSKLLEIEDRNELVAKYLMLVCLNQVLDNVFEILKLRQVDKM